VSSIIKAKNDVTGVEYRAFDYEGIDLFSEKYHAKGASFLSCIICGRDTSKKGKSQGVIIGEGGGVIVHPEDDGLAQDGGYMGWFPIGSECIKVIPVEFRLENVYENKVQGI